jgi:hypothetical protein
MVKGDRNVYDSALTGVAAAVLVAVLLLLGDRSNGDGGMRRRRGIPAAESGAGADNGGCCCCCWGASAAGTIEAAALSLQSCGRFCAVCAGAADSFGDRHEQAHECGVVAIDADETDDSGVAAPAEVAEVAVVAVEVLEPMLDSDTALSLEFVREMTDAVAAPKQPMPWGDASVGVDLPDTMMALSPTGLATALRKSV